MTTYLHGQNFPVYNIVPRSWSRHWIDVDIAAAGTESYRPKVATDWLNLWHSPVAQTELAVGYEEVFVIHVNGGLSANPILTVDFSMDNVSWFTINTYTLTTGVVTSQITTAALKRYPALLYLRYTITNPAASTATINGSITLRAR